ncbi:MAG: hypothetical protein LBT40_15295 [Deltaproteobacteria bacterium]|nr:hypothetical protein [Deltaproteobacteria bacterium]
MPLSAAGLSRSCAWLAQDKPKSCGWLVPGYTRLPIELNLACPRLASKSRLAFT